MPHSVIKCFEELAKVAAYDWAWARMNYYIRYNMTMVTYPWHNLCLSVNKRAIGDYDKVSGHDIIESVYNTDGCDRR